MTLFYDLTSFLRLGQISWIFFIGFLGDWKAPKGHSEISWLLAWKQNYCIFKSDNLSSSGKHKNTWCWNLLNKNYYLIGMPLYNFFELLFDLFTLGWQDFKVCFDYIMFRLNGSNLHHLDLHYVSLIKEEQWRFQGLFLIPFCLGWFGKRIKSIKSWTNFIKNSRIKTSKSVLTSSYLDWFWGICNT